MYTVATTIRGVAFDGTDLDGIDTPDRAAAAAAGIALDGTGSLTDCTLTGGLPCVLARRGRRESTAVEWTLRLPTEAHAWTALEVSLTVGAATLEASADDLEQCLRELEGRLPKDVALICCFTCRYSDYSPGGKGLSGMRCHRNAKEQYLAVRSKRDYFDVPTAEIVLETHLCDEWETRPPGTGYRG
jgi:Family of unknown function (DUF6304)